MVKVISELEKLGLELTDEQKEAVKKSMGEELYSKAELDKKVKTAETDRDNWKTRAETAEETLKGFDGKDLDTITKERDEWKGKAEKAEKEYNAKIAEREKEDLLKEAMKDIRFTSESARKSIMADIAANVSVKDGKLIGFGDLLADAKKNDSVANIKSMSSGGRSVSFGSNETLIDKVLGDKTAQNHLFYDTVCEYLAGTGLLYAGVG